MHSTLHRVARWARSFGLASAAAALTFSAQAQQVLRVTAIPDEAPTELARKFAPLGQYLEGKLGMKVEWTPVTDYAAAVEAAASRSCKPACGRTAR
jgi:phosphonate transport system substrate-binding protein